MTNNRGAPEHGVGSCAITKAISFSPRSLNRVGLSKFAPQLVLILRRIQINPLDEVAASCVNLCERISH
jgi:hypothetical protein